MQQVNELRDDADLEKLEELHKLLGQAHIKNMEFIRNCIETYFKGTQDREIIDIYKKACIK